MGAQQEFPKLPGDQLDILAMAMLTLANDAGVDPDIRRAAADAHTDLAAFKIESADFLGQKPQIGSEVVTRQYAKGESAMGETLAIDSWNSAGVAGVEVICYGHERSAAVKVACTRLWLANMEALDLLLRHEVYLHPIASQARVQRVNMSGPSALLKNSLGGGN